MRKLLAAATALLFATALGAQASVLRVDFDAGPTDNRTLGINATGFFTVDTTGLAIGTNNFATSVDTFSLTISQGASVLATEDASDLINGAFLNDLEFDGSTISLFTFDSTSSLIASRNTFSFSGSQSGFCNGCVTFSVSEIGIAPVPLPAGGALLLAGLGGLALMRRRTRTA